MRQLLQQIPYLNAGLISLIVGFSTSGIIVFEAAKASGASNQQITSWFWALCVGLGLLTIILASYYKKPIVIAWSTPGAALLIGVVNGFTLNEVMGAFVMCAILVMLIGFSGFYDSIVRHIPQSLASAMLAGVLVQFGIDLFVTLEQQFTLVGAMLFGYFATLGLIPRYSVTIALTIGMVYCVSQQQLNVAGLSVELANPVWTDIDFSFSAFVAISLPLFIITMASQNLPGSATLKAHGFQVPDAKLVGITGLTTLILAPFGAFCLNLAAIMAAICVSEEIEPDSKKRYKSAVWTGALYLLAGFFAASIVELFLRFPAPFVTALAGIALLSTITSSLNGAMADVKNRQANLAVFLLVGSGISLLNISGAFWGLVLGVIIVQINKLKLLKGKSSQ